MRLKDEEVEQEIRRWMGAPPLPPEQTIAFYRGMARDRFEALRAEGSIPLAFTWDLVQVALRNETKRR